MTASLQCLECGTPLDSAETGGLCPKCLLKLGLGNTHFGFTSAGLPATGGEPLEFGSCRVLRVLGKGGMGTVYEAEQKAGGRRVALKVLGQTLDSPELRSRFLREGQLAAAVRHPNVVGVLSAEEVEGTPMIAMELLHDGTLGERVKRHGPMALSEAIDATLQIVDGLAAAHAAGVLHRDVKPANCFISADGVVKVGDFGLSISTLSRMEHSLTQSGAVLGTPAFAAPEQLRGEELDERADIYSVGATLYFLLTGKTTHNADTLVSLIAAVLTKRPVDPRSLRKDIPAPLARVVMRCLERNKGQRYASYAALRAALERFQAKSAQPAMLGLRLVAGSADLFLSSSVWIAISTRMEGASWPEQQGWQSFWLWLAGLSFSILYFAVLEGRWGVTPGKQLCGLRVSLAGGGYPGFLRAFLRSLLFHVYWVIPPLLILLRGPYHFPGSAAETISKLLFLSWFATMRTRNGFAAVHDLLSKTRVVALPSPEEAPGFALAEILEPAPGAGGRLGPFLVLERTGGVVKAWDGVLRRPVWIVERPAGAPPVPEPRRNLNRAGRLRWLQGVRSAEENWDAYEAPSGRLLAELANGAQPWGQVRRWLSDLANEFTASSRGGTRPVLIGLNRVWITSHGHAIWMDFSLDGREEGLSMQDTAELQRFLALAGAACLAPHPPLHASRFMETLANARLDTAEMVAGNLRAMLTYPATLTRRRRLMTLTLWPVLALAFSILLASSLQTYMDDEIRSSRYHSSVEVKFKSGNLSPTAEITSTEHPTDPNDPELNLSPGGLRFLTGATIFALLLAMGSLVSFCWALVTAVPPGLHLYGLILLNAAGRPAPRWQVAIRSLLTGLIPGLILLTLVMCVGAALEQESRVFSIPVAAVSFLIVLLIGFFSCLRPQRALPDYLLGTVIVPR